MNPYPKSQKLENFIQGRKAEREAKEQLEQQKILDAFIAEQKALKEEKDKKSSQKNLGSSHKNIETFKPKSPTGGDPLQLEMQRISESQNLDEHERSR